MNRLTDVISSLHIPLGYSVPSNGTGPTVAQIKNWIQSKKPNLIQRASPLAAGGILALILGTILGLFCGDKNKSTTLFGGLLAIAGIAANVINFITGPNLNIEASEQDLSGNNRELDGLHGPEKEVTVPLIKGENNGHKDRIVAPLTITNGEVPLNIDALCQSVKLLTKPTNERKEAIEGLKKLILEHQSDRTALKAITALIHVFEDTREKNQLNNNEIRTSALEVLLHVLTTCKDLTEHNKTRIVESLFECLRDKKPKDNPAFQFTVAEGIVKTATSENGILDKLTSVAGDTKISALIKKSISSAIERKTLEAAETERRTETQPPHKNPRGGILFGDFDLSWD